MQHRVADRVSKFARMALVAGVLAPAFGCAMWPKEAAAPAAPSAAPAAPADPFAAIRPATASVGVTMPDLKDFQHPWDVSTYIMRVTLFGTLPAMNGGVAFVGDSLTDWGRWPEAYPDLRVRNFGIAGDTTVGLQHRISQVIDARPAKVFLMIGTNDVEFSRIPPEGIVANIDDIVTQMQNGIPGVKIYVESLLPREPKWDEKVRAVNALLKPMAERRGATYIDLYPLFVVNGRLDPKLTSDDIHVSGQGYVRWRDALRPYIASGS